MGGRPRFNGHHRLIFDRPLERATHPAHQHELATVSSGPWHRSSRPPLAGDVARRSTRRRNRGGVSSLGPVDSPGEGRLVASLRMASNVSVRTSTRARFGPVSVMTSWPGPAPSRSDRPILLERPSPSPPALRSSSTAREWTSTRTRPAVNRPPGLERRLCDRVVHPAPTNPAGRRRPRR